MWCNIDAEIHLFTGVYSMSRQSITITEPNANWLKAQVESKEYSSNSEIVNDLIRQARKQEILENEAIRALLQEGINSGPSTLTPAQIRQNVRDRQQADE
jgi:antitoxin ParD1/3/4